MSTSHATAVLLLLLGTLWFGVRVQGQLVKKGSCPTVSAAQGVTLHKLSRKWYQLQGIPTFFNEDASCITLRLHFLDFPNTFSYSFVSKGETKPSFLNGFSFIPDYNNPGKFRLSFEARGMDVEANNTAVYLTEDVLVLYGCLDLPCLPGFYAVFTSIYSSIRGDAPATEIQAAYGVINVLGVTATEDLVTFKNDPCPDHFADEDPKDHYPY